MVILLIVTALISDFQEYRNLARLFPELPAGCPYLDVATGYKNLDYILFVTCVFGFVLTISLDFLYYLICSNTRRQGSLWSSWPSQGLRCGLNTHRGPKSPARERNHPGALLFATAVLYSMAFMSTLNPYATPWRPEGSDAATGVSEAQNTPHKPSSSWAKHSGLGPSHDRPDVQPFSKKKSFLRALKRAQLHGMTWYKGKLYSASMLGTSQIETPPRALTPEKPTGPAPSGNKLKANRLSGFNWNIGALSNYKLDILKAWMIPQPLSVLTIQDTRWGFTPMTGLVGLVESSL